MGTSNTKHEHDHQNQQRKPHVYERRGTQPQRKHATPSDMEVKVQEALGNLSQTREAVPKCEEIWEPIHIAWIQTQQTH